MNLNLRNLHILVVEDTRAMQQLLVELLKTLGVGTVTTASDGQEGFRFYMHRKPDLIVTDWHMPNMDGLEMIKKIRRAPNSPDRSIPIIMLTGFCGKKRISLARDNGVTEFLIKPFTMHDLAKRISHIIQNPRDVIVTPHFVGPDRRRKLDENFSGPSLREKETHQRITAKDQLQKKAGKGIISTIAVERAQTALEETKIDFTPIAKQFLAELLSALHQAKTEVTTTKLTIQNMIFPVMQIKANARIFKYDLIGDLATIMLNFLEGLHEIDLPAIQIIEAHHKTVTHLLDARAMGNGGAAGQSLEAELELACSRYKKAITAKHKTTLKKIVENK